MVCPIIMGRVRSLRISQTKQYMNDANNVLIAKNNSVFLKGASNVMKPRLVTSAKQRRIITTSDTIPNELHYSPG